MKNKGIVIELTALLDVIMIMLFWVMLNMDRETEKIKTDAAEKIAESEQNVAAMSYELNEAREQYKDVRAQYDNAQAELERYIEIADGDAAAAQKALAEMSEGHVLTINLTNGEYLIYYESDVLGRTNSVGTTADFSGSIIAALDKAGFEKDDVITCAFVYGRNARINDITRMREAESKVSKLYDNFYCSYIKIPY